MITTVQFKTLDDLFDYYNKELFDNTLKDCIVNMSRKGGAYGFIAFNRWKTADGEKRAFVHEISLNPDYLDRPFIEWHATLVHEMCHQWQYDYGEPSRNGYHNKEWGKKMKQVGLIPSNTGAPGGKQTGQNMTHYIDTDGQFIKAFNKLSTATLEGLRLKYLPAYTLPSVTRRKQEEGYGTEGGDPPEGGGEGGSPGAITPKISKQKYSCPCGNNVWGKPGLNIVCGDCGENFEEA
jgi:predicted SprT family Zn-dependent metalloprotease